MAGREISLKGSPHSPPSVLPGPPKLFDNFNRSRKRPPSPTRTATETPTKTCNHNILSILLRRFFGIGFVRHIFVAGRPVHKNAQSCTSKPCRRPPPQTPPPPHTASTFWRTRRRFRPSAIAAA